MFNADVPYLNESTFCSASKTPTVVTSAHSVVVSGCSWSSSCQTVRPSWIWPRRRPGYTRRSWHRWIKWPPHIYTFIFRCNLWHVTCQLGKCPFLNHTADRWGLSDVWHRRDVSMGGDLIEDYGDFLFQVREQLGEITKQAQQEQNGPADAQLSQVRVQRSQGTLNFLSGRSGQWWGHFFFWNDFPHVFIWLKTRYQDVATVQMILGSRWHW